MGKLCPHCGMESDTDDVCSWCGKALAAEQAETPAASDELPSAPGKGRRAHHEGAAAALVAAEAARRSVPVWPKYAAGAGLLVLFIMAWSVFSLIAKSKPPLEPTGWQQVQTQTNELSLEVPTNWKFSTSGAGGSFEKAFVRSGKSCEVTIFGSGTLGAMGDISGASRAVSAETPLEKRPEGKLHAQLGGFEEDNDPHYAEDEMQAVTFMGAAAAYSVYTTSKRAGVFSVKIKGWRLTVPGIGDYSYNVHAQCPAKHWDEFEPIAQRILQSVTPGGGQ